MPQIFVTATDEVPERYQIHGDDYHHLSRVRRVKKNDIINLRDDRGFLVRARIAEITDSEIIAEAIEKIHAPAAGIFLHVAVSLLKGKKFDFVIQKLTELGAARIIPVVSARSIPVLKDRGEHKKDRWMRIIESASKQCMRNDIPVIEEITPLEEYLSSVTRGIKIIAHPEGGVKLHRYLASFAGEHEAHLLIGPEGGFSDREIAEALHKGWQSVQFGFTSLRAETAAIILPSLIMYEWDN